MIKTKKINSEYLKNLYKNSINIKKSRKYKGIKHFCLEPIIIEKEENFSASSEWFINSHNELIYEEKDNKYFNLEMFENDESIVKNVYILEKL
jgi:hypothetical protein